MSRETIDFESWVALDSERLLTDQERHRMSMPWRLWEIALSHVNNYGHAAFHKDELIRLACGEVTRANRGAVYRGLKILAEMDRIAPVGDKGSTLLCIMVNGSVGKRKGGKGNYTFLCSEISHMDMRQTPFGSAPESSESAPKRAEDAPYVDLWAEPMEQDAA